MTSRPWDDDERLFRDLTVALRSAGSLQEKVQQIGEGAFAWYGVDTDMEFASLIYDSLLAAEPVVRGDPAGPHRTVVFESSSVSVQLETSGDTVVGQVVPAEEGEICVVAAGGDVTRTSTDDLGCFCLTKLPQEPVRLRWRTATANVLTDWIVL